VGLPLNFIAVILINHVNLAIHNCSRPEFWGGFKIIPQSVEFWQGRPSRLHDRYLFTKRPDKEVKEQEGHGWDIVRLSP
jgi:pyridoxamine 5'-phosphate oxidase